MLISYVTNVISLFTNVILSFTNVTFPCNATTHSTNVNKRGKEKRNSKGQRNTNVTQEQKKLRYKCKQGDKGTSKKTQRGQGLSGNVKKNDTNVNRQMRWLCVLALAVYICIFFLLPDNPCPLCVFVPLSPCLHLYLFCSCVIFVFLFLWVGFLFSFPLLFTFYIYDSFSRLLQM